MSWSALVLQVKQRYSETRKELNEIFFGDRKHNMKTELKIKILTLASEAVHIKRHERRWKKVRLDELHNMPHPKFFTLQAHRLRPKSIA